MNFDLFDSDRKLMPAYCWPLPDELLSSWLSRMAYDHGMSTKAFCKAIMLPGKSRQDIDRYLSDEGVKALAVHTNCDAKIIRSTTLQHYIGSAFEKNNNGCVDWLITSSCYNKPKNYASGLMYCPTCLQEKPYFKKQWRLAASFVCVDCGCYLIDNCPHCKSGNSFIDKDCENHLYGNIKEYMTVCHHCGEDVTDCERVQAPDNLINAQKAIYEVIEHGPKNKVMTSSASYFKAVYGLCRYLLLGRDGSIVNRHFIADAFEGADVIKERIPVKYGIFDLDKLSAVKRAGLLTVSTWLLEEWPNRFVELCKKNNLSFSELQARYLNPENWFAKQLRKLSFETVKRKFVPARKDQEQYLMEFDAGFNNYIDYDYDVSEYYYNNRFYDRNGEPEPVDWLGFMRSCYGTVARIGRR